jgi:hypothetical protein
MVWQAISRESLDDMIEQGLSEATAEERALFARTAVTPTKWQLSPWGDLGGGFWVVAVMDDRVLCYNDIEHGFNVSRFTNFGTIPSADYWCNQDELRWALGPLAGKPTLEAGFARAAPRGRLGLQNR